MVTDGAGRSAATKALLVGLLLLAVAAIGLAVTVLVRAATGPSLAAVTATPRPTAMVTPDQPIATAVAQVTPTIGLATPWGVLGLDGDTPATAVPTADLPEQPPVILLGPPPGSQFREGDMVTFYWDWPGSLREGWAFRLYVGNAGGQTPAGTAEAGNLGTVQQLGVVLGDVAADSGDYQWWVAVEETASGRVIAGSERRAIVVLANGDR